MYLYTMNSYFFCLLFVLLFVLPAAPARCQNDTLNLYYEAFPEKITSRYYFSRKYTALEMRDPGTGNRYRFEPNSTLNMGVGATYQNLTLNLAYGFGFLNPDLGQGDSKYLDLQAHMYPKKFVIDFFGQFYRGYHVDGQESAVYGPNRFVVLPDMSIRKIGASVQYLFNGDKLSLRAAFLQNEWQKKSAASMLLGFEMYGGQASNEEGLLHPLLLNQPGGRFEQIRFFEFGPNVGYVGTLVIAKHFFLTGSVSSNLGVGYLSSLDRGDQIASWQLNPNLFLRGFAGYNNKTWSVNVNYVLNQVRLPNTAGLNPALFTGNYRFNLIYRFVPGPRISRHLQWFDRLRESVQKG
ncbi:DUF4421 domain-containing protein [Lunatimonas sp.]|uniref:DUF4421 domain-containing protein n=1 Tax=Lunatimonas sp. TaxID=2060141 RepID=UPI00263BE481|nr:DUF4421 domain-containing protein [Lunatimonas sp.]